MERVMRVERRPAIGMVFGFAVILIFVAVLIAALMVPQIGRGTIQVIDKFQQWQIAAAQRNEEAMQQRRLEAVRDCNGDTDAEAKQLGLVDPPKPVSMGGTK